MTRDVVSLLLLNSSSLFSPSHLCLRCAVWFPFCASTSQSSYGSTRRSRLGKQKQRSWWWSMPHCHCLQNRFVAVLLVPCIMSLKCVSTDCFVKLMGEVGFCWSGVEASYKELWDRTKTTAIHLAVSRTALLSS